jgi:hypothetical protein
MLHYLGDITAMELSEKARFYIPIYEKPGESVCLVAYKDLQTNKKRYVKFEKLAGVSDWIFVDLVD